MTHDPNYEQGKINTTKNGGFLSSCTCPTEGGELIHDTPCAEQCAPASTHHVPADTKGEKSTCTEGGETPDEVVREECANHPGVGWTHTCTLCAEDKNIPKDVLGSSGQPRDSKASIAQESVCNNCFDDGFKGTPCPHAPPAPR